MTFEEALAQTMSIVGLLDVGGCRILDADGFQALLGNAQRQRPIVIIAPRGSAYSGFRRGCYSDMEQFASRCATSSISGGGDVSR